MSDSYSVTLERFADIVFRFRIVGYGDITPLSYIDEGVPYLEFDTDDFQQDTAEFRALIRAEELAHTALGITR